MVFKSKLKKPKFKQTVVLYDGLHIASGVDGVTKVPRTFKHLGTSHNDWKSLRTVEEFRRKWQNLHDEALRQERKMQVLLSEYESALAEEKAEWEAQQAAQKRRRAADAQDANVIDSALGKYKLYIKAKQKGKTK